MTVVSRATVFAAPRQDKTLSLLPTVDVNSDLIINGWELSLGMLWFNL